MKTQIHSFVAVLALALSVGLMAGCSQQDVEEELLGLGKERPSGESVPEEIHATLKKDEVVIGHALPMTMREVMVPGGEQNGVETKFWE